MASRAELDLQDRNSLDAIAQPLRNLYVNCLPQKPLTDGGQIILTDSAYTEIAVNIKPRKCTEYSISNRGVLACKKLISVRIGALLIIRNVSFTSHIYH